MTADEVAIALHRLATISGVSCADLTADGSRSPYVEVWSHDKTLPIVFALDDLWHLGRVVAAVAEWIESDESCGDQG